MVLVRFIAACALVLATSSHTLSACGGWTASPTERMACCERNADCDEPAMADACCAAGERGDDSQTAAVTVAAPPPRVFAFLAPVSTAEHHEACVSAAHPSSIPTYVRNSVFLI